jgi:O-acetyl-ADP-ribose deacetylase (regulator of RNase III)
MIKIHVAEDMLDHMTTQDMVVHGCNAQGVMGAGFAKQIKQRFPAAFQAYRRAYGAGLGTITLSRSALGESDEPIICNMITQQNIAQPWSEGPLVSYDAIYNGFDKVFRYAKKHNLTVNFPLIGAGLGGGQWQIISAIIEFSENKFDVSTQKHLWVKDQQMKEFLLQLPYHCEA